MNLDELMVPSGFQFFVNESAVLWIYSFSSPSFFPPLFSGFQKWDLAPLQALQFLNVPGLHSSIFVMSSFPVQGRELLTE